MLLEPALLWVKSRNIVFDLLRCCENHQFCNFVVSGASAMTLEGVVTQKTSVAVKLHIQEPNASFVSAFDKTVATVCDFIK